MLIQRPMDKDELRGHQPLRFKEYPYIRSYNYYAQSDLDVLYEVMVRDDEAMIVSPLELFGTKCKTVEEGLDICREHHKNLILNQ